MTRAAPLFALLLLSLTACETVEGFKRDTGKLWARMQPAPAAGTDVPASQTAASDASLTPPIASGCPSITIMPELKTLTEFSDPAKPSDKTKISEFTMVGVQSECKQHAAALAMHIDLIFTGKLGPKAKANKSDKPSFAYPYFIAVTDSSGTVVAKEIFAASVAYGAAQKEIKQIETITQNLPVKKEDDLKNYRVLVGFQLDDSQLAYNREKQQ